MLNAQLIYNAQCTMLKIKIQQKPKFLLNFFITFIVLFNVNRLFLWMLDGIFFATKALQITIQYALSLFLDAEGIFFVPKVLQITIQSALSLYLDAEGIFFAPKAYFRYVEWAKKFLKKHEIKLLVIAKQRIIAEAQPLPLYYIVAFWSAPNKLVPVGLLEHHIFYLHKSCCCASLVFIKLHCNKLNSLLILRNHNMLKGVNSSACFFYFCRHKLT